MTLSRQAPSRQPMQFARDNRRVTSALRYSQLRGITTSMMLEGMVEILCDTPEDNFREVRSEMRVIGVAKAPVSEGRSGAASGGQTTR